MLFYFLSGVNTTWKNFKNIDDMRAHLLISKETKFNKQENSETLPTR